MDEIFLPQMAKLEWLAQLIVRQSRKHGKSKKNSAVLETRVAW